ncbi:unnamed protein product [Leptidea sinapis]|uniref:Digestive organ expansion factor homolog n=2 Tax=Leptidea sinapis TaxID=189913 RepID=A0A5E4PZU2_9NEOP|nr:unnamed protein product [Leptidea sinapis]
MKSTSKRRKAAFKSNFKKRKPKEIEKVNKKALFNRYKDKQKVQELSSKRKQLDEKLKLQQETYSESEQEEDTFEQLISCFAKKKHNVASDSDEDESPTASDLEGDVPMKSPVCKNNLLQNYSTDQESDDEVEVSENMQVIANDKESEDDPFTKHLQYDISDELLVSLTNTPTPEEQISKVWPVLGKYTVTIPQPLATICTKTKPKVSIVEDTITAPIGNAPQICSQVNFDKLFIKSQISGNIVSANKTNLIKRDLELSEVLTPLQRELFATMNNYQDLYYPCRSFTNADEIRFTYCLHVANHMLKTRIKILHHNAKLTKKSDVPDEYRDQGLVRPKVLILVPFRDAAYRVVKTLIDIVVPKEAGQVVNKKRFEDDFTGGELIMPSKNPKPEDYELLFSGNTEDTFRLGLTITKKTLKLYTDFYSSDILIASPLGLRMIIGAEGEEDRDYDFLASIELLILDQADVFLMQNWDHLLHILDHFHLQPKKTHGTDFSRVRTWAANGWSKYYRFIINKKCQNYVGKVIVDNHCETGSIQQVILQVPQLFHRFTATSPLSSVDARFEYFIKEILPKQRDPLMNHTLIYVPSYFDFVRLRNYFKKEDISFDGKIARARDMFFHTEAHFLLYSERVHFFRRFRIKGIRHLIFYQPPTYPHFYSEMCNLMQESNQNKYGGSSCNMSVSTLYSKYDLQRTSAVLGAERLARVAASDKSVHMFVTGDK